MALDKDVIRDGIPGIVNAGEKQQEHGRRDAKQSFLHVRPSRERRRNQYSVALGHDDVFVLPGPRIDCSTG